MRVTFLQNERLIRAFVGVDLSRAARNDAAGFLALGSSWEQRESGFGSAGCWIRIPCEPVRARRGCWPAVPGGPPTLRNFTIASNVWHFRNLSEMRNQFYVRRFEVLAGKLLIGDTGASNLGPCRAGRVAGLTTCKTTEPSTTGGSRRGVGRFNIASSRFGLAVNRTTTIAGEAMATTKIKTMNSGCTSFHPTMAACD